MKFCYNRLSSFSEEIVEIVNGRTDDGWTMDDDEQRSLPIL